MKLSPVVGRYFDSWLRHDTWDSYHLFDRQRFYCFVKAVARYSRRAPPPGDIEDLIEERWKDRRTTFALTKAARHFASIYQEILAYEKTRDFPNAVIERTDIVRFYYSVIEGQGKPNTQHINMVMRHAWGNDWRRKLDEKRVTLGQPPNKERKAN